MEELLWAKSEQILLVGVSGIRYSSISKTVAKGRKDSNIKKWTKKDNKQKRKKKPKKNKHTNKQKCKVSVWLWLLFKQIFMPIRGTFIILQNIFARVFSKNNQLLN